MLKKYRIELGEVIKEANMNPFEFRPIDADTNEFQLLRLELGDSAFHFSVKLYYDSSGNRRFAVQRVRYIRGYPRPNYSEGSFYNADNFEIVKNAFREWLNENAQKYFEDKAEQEEDKALQDLWAELDLPSSSSTEPQILQNAPFSSEEHKRIADALKNLKEEVQSAGLFEEKQIKLLQERIEYLTEASKRLGRRDWMMAATGALIELTIEAGLKSEAAKQFLQLAGEAIRWIIESPLLLS